MAIKTREAYLSEVGPMIQFGTVALGTTGRYVSFAGSFKGSPGVTITRMTGGMTAQAGTVTTSGIIKADRISSGSMKITPDSGTPTVMWNAFEGRTNL